MTTILSFVLHWLPCMHVETAFGIRKPYISEPWSVAGSDPAGVFGPWVLHTGAPGVEQSFYFQEYGEQRGR